MLSSSPSPPVGIFLPNPIKPMPTHVTPPQGRLIILNFMTEIGVGGPIKQPVSPIQPTSGTFAPPEKKNASQQDSIESSTPVSNTELKSEFPDGFTLAPLKS